MAETSGTFYGVSMTAGDLYTIADVGVSGSPSSAINMGNVAAPGNGMSVDGSGNIVVGDGDGVDFVNEQSTGSLSLYGLTIPHQSSAVLAGTAQGGSDCAAGATSDPASTLFFQSAAPFFDGSDNVYFSDNENGINGGGCVWVLPAQSGTLDGLRHGWQRLQARRQRRQHADDRRHGRGPVQRGRHHPDDGRLGRQRRPGRPEWSEFGTSPAILVLAETTGTYYGVHDRGGRLYGRWRCVEPLGHPEWPDLDHLHREREPALHRRRRYERQSRRVLRCSDGSGGCSDVSRPSARARTRGGGDQRHHHGHQSHRSNRGRFRVHGRGCHRRHGDVDHGDLASGICGHSRRHGDHAQRHLGHLEC